MPVPGASGGLAKEEPLAGFEDDLSRTIVDCEINSSEWTLMHRYNKATELLEQALSVSTQPGSNGALSQSHGSTYFVFTPVLGQLEKGFGICAVSASRRAAVLRGVNGIRAQQMPAAMYLESKLGFVPSRILRLESFCRGQRMR